MNLLDRLLLHDAWTTRQLLLSCRTLTDEQLDREFDLGFKTLRETFRHTIFNMEVWTDLMRGDTVDLAVYRQRPKTIDALIKRLDETAANLSVLAHDIEARNAWDTKWVDTLDNPPNEKTYGAAIAHVITHSMHHRCQIIHMLKRLGVPDVPEGDALSWEAQTKR